jgi:glutamate dehydrogenase (NAD(P)+)
MVNDPPRLEVDVYGPGLQAWVVADTTVDGAAMGGTRMTPNVSLDEVRALARGMTHKLHLVGLPLGGAKAGIVDGPVPRDATLREFGTAVAPLLKGGIHLGCDMGIRPQDRCLFSNAAGYHVPRDVPRYPYDVDWEEYWAPMLDITGFGVATATTIAMDALKLPIPSRVVIEGFGMVGRALATHLHDRGHLVVGVADRDGLISSPSGLPVKALSAAADSHGSIDRDAIPDGLTVTGPGDQWIDVPTDVLVLAANANAIHEGNVERTQACLVVEGGNICCTPAAKNALRASGVLVVPDVVANAGAASVGGCALTGTVPGGLGPVARRSWLFDWVSTRIAGNTRDLIDIAATEVDPLPQLLRDRESALNEGTTW